MNPLPDECSRPTDPRWSILEKEVPSYVKGFREGADLRRKGKPRPTAPTREDLDSIWRDNAWRVRGWEAQNEIAIEEGYA